MNPSPVILPIQIAQRVGPDLATRIVGAGETALLSEPLLGIIASRECPGHVLLETLDRVPEWVKAGRVIVSGFHSPLEQQVLTSLLRRKGRAVKVLARSLAGYKPEPQEKEALAASRMLLLSNYPSEITRTTRSTALERNQLVLMLASEHYVPYLSESSPLRELLSYMERTQ